MLATKTLSRGFVLSQSIFLLVISGTVIVRLQGEPITCGSAGSYIVPPPPTVSVLAFTVVGVTCRDKSRVFCSLLKSGRGRAVRPDVSNFPRVHITTAGVKLLPMQRDKRICTEAVLYHEYRQIRSDELIDFRFAISRLHVSMPRPGCQSCTIRR